MAGVQTDLTQGSVTKQLIKYALPLVVSSLLQSIYSITDMIVADRCVGSAGVSAINTACVVMNMITQIAIGLTVGGNILVGQYFGRREHDSRKRAAGTLFTLCLVVGLVAAAVLCILAEPLMKLLNAPTLTEAVDYFSICAIGVFFIFSYNALSAILRGVGNSKLPLYCIIVSVVLNIVLDILFMAVFRWGVKGAALATVIGQCVSFIVALIFCIVNGKELGIGLKFLRLPGSIVKQTLRLGMPTALQFTIASISWLTVIALINSYGEVVSAGNGAANKIRDFCQVFITAMTTGAGTMCAQCIGAQMYDRAEKVMKTCLKITVGMALVIIALAEIFAPQLCSIFASDPEVQHWAVINLRIEIVCQLFYAGMFSYNTLATGSGHTMFLMWNTFLNCIVVRLVLALLLNWIMGPNGIYGVYIACGVAVASSVPVGMWFYRSNRWRTSLVK
ncbi:MAG: MATE family efflux transporter [Oscillospiraceae bacterium]|nr:MATE family efflux transporter [Oscillospiraceae bacterium]